MPFNRTHCQPLKNLASLCCNVRMAALLLAFTCLGNPNNLSASPWQQPLKDLQTIAERSDFTETSNYSDVLNFVDQCAATEHVTRIDFGKSVEGRAMVGTLIANPPFSMETAEAGPNPDPRLRILLLGNIHSGECAGKEALLAMLRELALNPNHPWLSDCVILIAPNYNVDANERVGLNQRPGQVGPSKGMGQRENAMQLDLNRDFVKLESPEARSLVKLIDDFNPHLFIDCHTTNGSRHQYLLTYDIPHNPTSPQVIRDYLRNNMMPQVTQKLEDKDILTFYYGNFSRDNSRWSTYGHEPRYSTEYVGLRGRLGILSEAYSYATYEDRIKATDAFVKECVEHVRDHADDVKDLLDLPVPKTEELVHLDSQMAAFPDKYVIRGYEGEQKKDYEVTFFGDYRPTTTVTMPTAYAFPAEMSFLAERLRMHGIEIEQLADAAAADPSIKGRAYKISAIDRSPRPFQKHNMVRLEVAADLEDVDIPGGSFIVSTRQPLGRLVSYVLEPETNEGFVTWNFLDPWLSVGDDYPIYRIENNQYSSHPVNEIQPGRALKLTDIFGPNKLPLGDLSLGQVQWLADGSSYSVEKNGRRLSIDAASGSENRLALPFDVADVASAMKPIGGPDRAQISQLLSDGIELRGAEQKLFLLNHDGKTFVYDSAKQKAVRLGDDAASAELADLNPAGDQVAFVQANNLLLLKDIDSSPTQITNDGTATLLNGKLDWVYQEELYGRGNFKAFWWAPDGSALAFLKIDESAVHPFTVTDHIPVRSRLEVTAYPKAGDPLPTVDLGIYNLAKTTTCWAKLPEVSNEPLNELLISRVTWEPDSVSLLVQIQNRIQSWLDLSRVQADTGEMSVVFRDETPAWITSPGDPLFLSDGSFLWLSPRSGYNAIYRHAKTGTELAKLTTGDWEVRELLGFDEAKGYAYFTGTPDTPTRVVPMRAKMDGSEVSKLVDMPGSFSVKFNPTHQWFLAEHSTAHSQDEILLFDADGRFLRNVIPKNDELLRHLAISPPEFIQIPIGEEDFVSSLDAMLIKPQNFDPQKTYPVVVHVYGGPQAPRVRDRFAGQTYLWHQYLAQQGMVVFVVDNRSCSYRSADQVWPIYKDLARRELADVEWATNWLINHHSWADRERLGLWGWSYGGYMTAYALTHSKLFACGIAGAPVTDWRNYDAIYTERYMDTPQANPRGYDESSVLPVAGDLQGQLLLIHGTIDDNVHLGNTLQFVKALQTAGKQFELMVYPENRHAVRDPEQRLHLYQLMTDFLIRNLHP